MSGQIFVTLILITILSTLFLIGSKSIKAFVKEFLCNTLLVNCVHLDTHYYSILKPH